MPQDIFDNASNQGLIAQTKLKNKYKRDFANHTDYFDKLDVNNIKFADMATDLHVMTKNENGDYVSEPLNVALSRIKATTSTAACTDPNGKGLTEAEYAMKVFWFAALNSDIGLHVYVNTEPDANKPKNIEAKFIDISVIQSLAPNGTTATPEYDQMSLLEERLEDRSRKTLDTAKAAGRHCDSKGWLNFKKFFSSKATKEKLQNEYDDYQDLKKKVARDEVRYRAATQSKCETYSDLDPDKIATIEKETFEANKREVAKYNENEKAAKMQLEANEKAANMQLAAKVINKCADKLPDFEKMYMHYVNALMSNEGFKKHTLGYTNTILGNEKEEAKLIKYITQNRIDEQASKLSETIAAAKDSFAKTSAIKLDKPEPENAIPENEKAIPDNAPKMVINAVENDVQPEFTDAALNNIVLLMQHPDMEFLQNSKQTVAESLIKNNAVFEKYFNNKSPRETLLALNSPDFKAELYSEENLNILKLAQGKIQNVSPKKLDNHVREKLKEATREINMVKETESASFVAERMLDALAINGNDKISLEEKDKARKALSANETIKSFVIGKSVAEIKSMQKDPNKQQEYQAVINTVILEYATKDIATKDIATENIATENIVKNPKDIAPKNIDNKKKLQNGIG